MGNENNNTLDEISVVIRWDNTSIKMNCRRVTEFTDNVEIESVSGLVVTVPKNNVLVFKGVGAKELATEINHSYESTQIDYDHDILKIESGLRR